MTESLPIFWCLSHLLTFPSTTGDSLASISRACVAFSLIVTYPIIFMGFRDGMLDVFAVPHELQTTQNLNVFTVALLLIVTVLATVLTDLGVIVGKSKLGCSFRGLSLLSLTHTFSFPSYSSKLFLQPLEGGPLAPSLCLLFQRSCFVAQLSDWVNKRPLLKSEKSTWPKDSCVWVFALVLSVCFWRCKSSSTKKKVDIR